MYKTPGDLNKALLLFVYPYLLCSSRGEVCMGRQIL